MYSIRSVVGVPLVIASWASKEDCASFIGRPKLLLMIENFFVSTLLTWLLDGSLSLHVGF